jgi:hypothetical protein
MEAASTSETSVNFYETTRRYNPENSHLHHQSGSLNEPHESEMFTIFTIALGFEELQQYPQIILLSIFTFQEWILYKIL